MTREEFEIIKLKSIGGEIQDGYRIWLESMLFEIINRVEKIEEKAGRAPTIDLGCRHL